MRDLIGALRYSEAGSIGSVMQSSQDIPAVLPAHHAVPEHVPRSVCNCFKLIIDIK